MEWREWGLARRIDGIEAVWKMYCGSGGWMTLFRLWVALKVRARIGSLAFGSQLRQITLASFSEAFF